MMSRYEVFYHDIRKAINDYINYQEPEKIKTIEKVQDSRKCNDTNKRHAWYSQSYVTNKGEEIIFSDKDNNEKRATQITTTNTPPTDPKYQDYVYMGEVKDIKSILNYNFLNNYF